MRSVCLQQKSVLVTSGGAMRQQGCRGLARVQPWFPGKRGAPSHSPPAAGSSRHPEIQLCSPNASPEETHGDTAPAVEPGGYHHAASSRSSSRAPLTALHPGVGVSGGVADRARLAPALHGDVPEADRETCGGVATPSLPWLYRAPARSRKVTRTPLLPSHGVLIPQLPLPALPTDLAGS